MDKGIEAAARAACANTAGGYCEHVGQYHPFNCKAGRGERPCAENCKAPSEALPLMRESDAGCAAVIAYLRARAKTAGSILCLVEAGRLEQEASRG